MPSTGAVAPTVPSLTAVNVTIIVSSFSGVVSSVITKAILPVVAPAEIVNIPPPKEARL